MAGYSLEFVCSLPAIMGMERGLLRSARQSLVTGRVGLQSPQPHFKDGTTYHPFRPTQLDKIENFYVEGQGGRVGRRDSL